MNNLVKLNIPLALFLAGAESTLACPNMNQLSYHPHSNLSYPFQISQALDKVNLSTLPDVLEIGVSVLTTLPVIGFVTAIISFIFYSLYLKDKFSTHFNFAVTTGIIANFVFANFGVPLFTASSNLFNFIFLNSMSEFQQITLAITVTIASVCALIQSVFIWGFGQKPAKEFIPMMASYSLPGLASAGFMFFSYIAAKQLIIGIY